MRKRQAAGQNPTIRFFHMKTPQRCGFRKTGGDLSIRQIADVDPIQPVSAAATTIAAAGLAPQVTFMVKEGAAPQ